MDKGPPPAGGDYDRGLYAVALFWVMGGVGVVTVALRFIGRYMIRSTGLDDWMMLFTLILFMLFSAFLTKDATVGGMRHLYYLTPDEIVEALKWNWLCQPYVIMGFATGKISIGLLILRIIGPNTFWRKWILWGSISIAFILSSINIILTYAQCTPVEALWNPALIMQGKAKCWPSNIQTDFAIFLGSMNVVIDAILAVLPATIFYKLNLSWSKKIGLCVLLGLGMIAAICAAIKTQYLVALNARSDLTWETYNLYVWSGAELFVIIVCGSIPPIKPIYDRYCAKPKSNTAKATGYGLYGSYGSNGASQNRSRGAGSRPDPYGERKLDTFGSGRHDTFSDRRALTRDDYDLEGYPRTNSTDESYSKGDPFQASPPIHHEQRPTPQGRMLPAGDIRVPLR